MKQITLVNPPELFVLRTKLAERDAFIERLIEAGNRLDDYRKADWNGLDCDKPDGLDDWSELVAEWKELHNE